MNAVGKEAVLTYQVLMTNVQGMLYLDGEKKGVQFPFLYLLHSEVSWPKLTAECLCAAPGFQPAFRDEVKSPKALADPASCWLFTL